MQPEVVICFADSGIRTPYTGFLGLFLPPNYFFPPPAQEDQFASLCAKVMHFLKQKAPFRTNF